MIHNSPFMKLFIKPVRKPLLQVSDACDLALFRKDGLAATEMTFCIENSVLQHELKIRQGIHF